MTAENSTPLASLRTRRAALDVCTISDALDRLGLAGPGGGILTRRRARARGIVDVVGFTVHAGDYVVADSSGIVFVSAQNIGVVLDAAEEIVARAAALAERVAASQSMMQAPAGR